MHSHGPLDYIKNLHLATAKELYANDATNQGSAAVVTSTVAVFDPNCQPQDEQDIKDAFCLAQLAATKKFPRNDQAIDYFNEMKIVLSNIGFMVVDFDWNDINTSSKDFSVENALFDLLKTILAPEALGLVEKTLAALKSAQDSGKPAWQIFSSNSHDNNNAKFSVGVVAPDGNNTKVQLQAFKMHASQLNENFLWFKWSSQSLSLQTASVKFILNSQLYAQFRTAVQQKLGIKGKDFIAGLDI